MLAVAHHALLVAAACGHLAAGHRVAAAAGARGVERAIGATVAAGVLVTASTLALGAVALAGRWWAHALVAAAAAVAARAALPPAGPPRLGRWWRTLDARQRAGWGAGAGALGLVAGWQLARPWLGPDGVTHHVPIPLEWLATGRAGEAVDTVVGFPVGSYPLTFEVQLAWALALARGLPVTAVVTPLALAVGGVALWAALGRLGVQGAVRAAAVLTVAVLPAGAAYLGQPGTDLSAWAWACCALALALAATGAGARAAQREEAAAPALAALAVAAAGLSLGTKTTSAIPLALLLGWLLLRPSRRPWRALAIGALAAVAVAGLWPLRNLVDHGSPLWPFVPLPWGDPAPPAMDAVDGRLLAQPVASLRDGGARAYATLAGGGPLLALGACALAVAVRAPAVRALAAAGLLAVLAWSVAPYTSTPGFPEFGSLSVRYLLPALTACALAVAVAGARGGRRARAAALAVLGLATAVSLERLLRGYDPPHVPPAWVPLAGAIAGAVAFAGVRRAPPAPHAAAAAVAAIVLGLAAGGFVERHGRTGGLTAGVVSAATATPAFRADATLVAVGPQGLAPLTGDRLQHRVAFVTDRTPCPVLRRIAVVGVLAVRTDLAPDAARPMIACLRGIPPRHRDDQYVLWARG